MGINNALKEMEEELRSESFVMMCVATAFGVMVGLALGYLLWGIHG
jgi:hypothetical protein